MSIKILEGGLAASFKRQAKDNGAVNDPNKKTKTEEIHLLKLSKSGTFRGKLSGRANKLVVPLNESGQTRVRFKNLGTDVGLILPKAKGQEGFATLKVMPQADGKLVVKVACQIKQRQPSAEDAATHALKKATLRIDANSGMQTVEGHSLLKDKTPKTAYPETLSDYNRKKQNSPHYEPMALPRKDSAAEQKKSPAAAPKHFPGSPKFQDVSGLKRPVLTKPTDDSQFAKAQEKFSEEVAQRVQNTSEHELVQFRLPVEKTLTQRQKESRFCGTRDATKDLKDGSASFWTQKAHLCKKQDEIAAKTLNKEHNIALSLLPGKKLEALEKQQLTIKHALNPKVHSGNYHTQFKEGEIDQEHFHAHVNFSDRFLGGLWRDSAMWGQEEQAFMEYRGLRDAAVFCEDAGLTLSGETKRQPSPLLIENTQHIADLKSWRASATVQHDLKPLEANGQRAVNWLSMSAPNPTLDGAQAPRLRKTGATKMNRAEALAILFEQSLAAFTLAKSKASQLGKPCIIHTGKPLHASYNNQLMDYFTAQLLAARIAGVDGIEFYNVKRDTEKESLSRAQDVISKIGIQEHESKNMDDWVAELLQIDCAPHLDQPKNIKADLDEAADEIARGLQSLESTFPESFRAPMLVSNILENYTSKYVEDSIEYCEPWPGQLYSDVKCPKATQVEVLERPDAAPLTEQSSTPIHANYLSTSLTPAPNQYLIAAQQPNGTAAENERFLKMLQQKADAVIDLRKTSDLRSQSAHYDLPQRNSFNRDVKLESVSQDKLLGIPRKKLNIKNGQKSKEVDIVQFRNWPDHGVVSTDQLRQLRDVLLSYLDQGKSAVVHCRAGIGRTGTLITYAELHNKLVRQNANKLSVKDVIKETIETIVNLRRARGKDFVQTSEQTALVVRAIFEDLHNANLLKI